MTAALPLSHLLLALLVVAVWGINFVVIKTGLDHLPPLLFAALRFTFAFVPAVFFIPRPNVSWRNLIAYGRGAVWAFVHRHQWSHLAGPCLAGGANQCVLHHWTGNDPQRRACALGPSHGAVARGGGYGRYCGAHRRHHDVARPELSVVGSLLMGASAIMLAEPLPAWKLIAAALVMCGLALNVFWPYVMKWMRVAVGR